MVYNTNGQEYNPITKECSRWIILFLSNNSSWDNNSYEYFMTGDTLINDVQLLLMR